MKSRYYAMTIVELLTVISILSLIAAVCLPVFTSVRSHARTTTCLSNLSQLGRAVAAYRADYDGYLPYALDSYTLKGPPLDSRFAEPYLSKARQMPELTLVLEPYVRSKTVYCCPSEHPYDYDQLPYKTFFQEYGSSYSYDPYPAMLFQQDMAPDAAQTYLMGDYSFWHQGDSVTDGRLNELFTDLHVKNITWKEFLTSVQRP